MPVTANAIHELSSRLLWCSLVQPNTPDMARLPGVGLITRTGSLAPELLAAAVPPAHPHPAGLLP